MFCIVENSYYIWKHHFEGVFYVITHKSVLYLNDIYELISSIFALLPGIIIFWIKCSSMSPSEGTQSWRDPRPETYPKIIEIGSLSSENGIKIFLQKNQ